MRIVFWLVLPRMPPRANNVGQVFCNCSHISRHWFVHWAAVQVPRCRKRLTSIVAVAYRAAMFKGCCKGMGWEGKRLFFPYHLPLVSDIPWLGCNFFLSQGVASFTQNNTHVRTWKIGTIFYSFSAYTFKDSVLNPRPDKYGKSERENYATSFVFL